MRTLPADLPGEKNKMHDSLSENTADVSGIELSQTCCQKKLC